MRGTWHWIDSFPAKGSIAYQSRFHDHNIEEFALSSGWHVLFHSSKLLVRYHPTGQLTQIFIHEDLLEKGGT